MRTFVLSLKDMINKGLLSYSKKVGTGLDNCAGFRLTPDGLESIDNDIEELITPTELAAGGFANTDQSVATQVFKLNSTSEYVLIDNASTPKFGRVNAGITDLPLAGSELTVIDPYKYDDASSTVAMLNALGGINRWSKADFGKTVLFFNGRSVLFKSDLGRVNPNYYDTIDKWLVFGYSGGSGTTVIKSGCAHRGRLITGGFDTSNLWNSDWADYLDWQLDKVEKITPFMSGSDRSIPASTVAWSTIGGGDALWQIYPELAVTGSASLGDSDDDRPALFNYAKRNESGFMPLPYEDLLDVYPLGKNVVCFASDGVGALTMQSEPIATYGFKHLGYIGISNKGAVCGNDDMIIFIDTNNDLWAITSELQMNRLGYGNYGPNSIFYNDVLKEWYIGTSAGTLLYNKNGMTKLFDTNSISGLVRGTGVEDESVFYIQSGNSALNKGKKISSGVIDFGVQGLKSLTGIYIKMLQHIALGSANDLSIDISYSYDGNTFTTKTITNKVGHEGFLPCNITAKLFKVTIYTSGSFDDMFDIDDIVLNWQYADKRFTRGRYNAD